MGADNDVMDVSGKIAAITGAGSGMGRDMALQLASQGCHLALSDISEAAVHESASMCTEANSAVTVTAHVCDVSDEPSVLAWRDAVMAGHETDHINLLFNNAGIGGGGSMIEHSREDWERTFGVCWFGVYHCTRAFLPLLIASDEGRIVNTSSVNGFWASMGPTRPHTSYSAAKFAVKGFTEALVSDLRKNAPHVKASVVMPGHIGTAITLNSTKVLGHEVDANVTELAAMFRNNAPTTSEQAATVILDAVKRGQWRILVGDDAHVLDALVRDTPDEAYESSFIERMHEHGVLQGLIPDA